jgi:hypothetical protein
VTVPGIALSKEELMVKLGKDPYYSVHSAVDENENYAGLLEVFHQLHCVVKLHFRTIP